jgi:putative peptidoglycan lipid II flippase
MTVDLVEPAAPSTEPVPPKPAGLLRPVLGVSAIMVLAKLCGFGEKVVIAYYYGTSGSADVYFLVLGLVWAAVYMTKELVHPSLLPVYARNLSRPDAARAIFVRMFCWVGGSAVIAGLLTLAVAPYVVALAAPGFRDEQFASAAWLLRLCVPGAVILMAVAVTYTCLNARRSFVSSAAADLLSKLLIVLTVATLTTALGLGAVGVALLAAATAALFFHLLRLPDRVGLLRRPVEAARQDLAQVRRLMLPLVVGVVLSHVTDIADNLFASLLPRGHLSMLNYAKKVVEAVMLVGPAALATVVFAHAADLSATGRKSERDQLVNNSLRLLLFLMVPAAYLLWEFRAVVAGILFARGQFTAASAAGTGEALGVYSLGLVTLTVESLLVYCFYAQSDTRTPVIWGVVFAIVNIALAAVLMGPGGFMGIAAAFVLAKTGKVAVLGFLLHRGLGSLLGRGALRFLAVVLISTAATVVLVRLARLGFEGSLGLRPGLLVLGGYLLMAVTGYFMVAWFMGSSEARRLIWVAARTLRRQ